MLNAEFELCDRCEAYFLEGPLDLVEQKGTYRALVRWVGLSMVGFGHSTTHIFFWTHRINLHVFWFKSSPLVNNSSTLSLRKDKTFFL